MSESFMFQGFTAPELNRIIAEWKLTQRENFNEDLIGVMTESELAQRVLGDYSMADLRALSEFNYESIKYWSDDKLFQAESEIYRRTRYKKVFNLQRLNVAVDIIIRSKVEHFIESLGGFRNG